MELGCVCCVGAIFIAHWNNVEFDYTPASEEVVVAATQIQKALSARCGGVCDTELCDSDCTR